MIPHALPIRVNEGDVGRADESENPAEIGFLKVDTGRAILRGINSSARRHRDDFLVRWNQALGTFVAVAERLAGSRDLVDPRFENCRHRKIVHWNAKHDDIWESTSSISVSAS